MTRGQAVPSTVHEAVRWWAQRRLRFNVVLLAVGIFSFLGSLLMTDLMPRHPSEDPGDFLGMCCAVPVYALLANICYTAGPWMERIRPLADATLAHQRRQNVFRIGLWFSALLTALPLILLSVAVLIARLRPN